MHRSCAILNKVILTVRDYLVAFELGMLLRRRQHNNLPLGIDGLGHLVAVLWRVAKQLPDHTLHVFVRMSVAIPEDHMISWHFAPFALVLLLRFGHHRRRLLLIGDDGLF